MEARAASTIAYRLTPLKETGTPENPMLSIPFLRRVIAPALTILALLLSGCAAGGTLHPEYARLRPRDIAVLKVKNETISDLGSVAFGGLLQRAVIGAETHNVLELVRGAVEESLLKSGYSIAAVKEPLGFDPSAPQAGGAGSLPCQAIATTAVESWHADTLSNFSSFSMRYRFELRSYPAAELLYSGTFFCDHRDNRSQSLDGVSTAIRRSVAQALGALPPVSE